MGLLEGRTALVTGGARRLGRAIAEALAREGAGLVLHYGHSAAQAELAASGLRAQGVRCWTVRADLSDPAQAASLWDEARALAGSIDILVNSASGFPEDSLADFTPEGLEAALRLNALAPVLLARRFARQVAAGGPGGSADRGGTADRVIVNLLDSRMLGRMRAHFSYQASKRLLADFTRLLAMELAPAVRVNAVAPGMILPPEGLDPARQARLAATNLLGRWGKPQDVARAVVFLASSNFVTGQVLFVDGGGAVKESLFG